MKRKRTPHPAVTPTPWLLSCLTLLLSTCWSPERLVAGEQPIDLTADQLDIDRNTHTIHARGQVSIAQPDLLELRADEATYHLQKRQIQATGNIRLVRQGDLFTSERILLDLETKQGSMEQAVAELKKTGGRIQADQVNFHSQDSYSLKKAGFTYCDCPPGSEPAWELTADAIDIDRLDNTLTARDVQLRIQDVPVLWVPWWQHPFLPKRQSGLLYPTMQVGGANGFEIDLPYYWNIAPERDATLTLHPTTRRGMLTKLQYRYLGENYQGSVDTLNIFDTVQDRHRGLTLLSHRHAVGSWELDARITEMQTRDFLNDFQQKKLIDSRERRLESHVTADRLWLRQAGFTSFRSGAVWYSNLDAPDDRFTMQQLPFLHVHDVRPLLTLNQTLERPGANQGRFTLQSTGKIDSFYQSSGDGTQRLDLGPELHYWRPLPIGQFSGLVGVRETAYLVQGDPNQTGLTYDANVSREAATVQARLDFDLARTYGNGALKHTLEPTIQYTLVSATSQAALPNLDSTLRDFNVTNLYTANLFSGEDRMSAGQWVTYGLSSRLFGQGSDGAVRNLLTTTIGQRWAPEGDRDYWGGLPFSDVVAGVTWSPNDHWSLSLGGRYDPNRDLIESTESQLAYFDKRTTVTVGYHRNKPDPTIAQWLTEENRTPLEEISLQASLRLDDNWRWKQNSDYSLETGGLKSWRTGIGYDHSCWSLELSAGRDLSSQTSEHGGGFIGFFFTLKGLGGYGFSS
ncbi:MAG: LPS-assembly protein LptD [Magnetococcales bacterium]|nr:LPS-assembly protein LptD [Magnetococcales bacterium]